MAGGPPGPQRLTDRAGRSATALEWVSVVVIVASVFVLLGQLPFASLVEALEVWVADLGIWGPVVFGLIYVVAVVLLVPAPR
jgi:uncharacterized membrane protein YdjX (TVP38/TMEM64 family)